MTPLAHALATQLTLPKKERKIIDNGGAIKHVTGAICFEVTEIAELAFDLSKMQSVQHFVDDSLIFLPSDVTWLEFRDEEIGRVGWMLRNLNEKEWWTNKAFDVIEVCTDANGVICTSEKAIINVDHDGKFGWAEPEEAKLSFAPMVGWICAVLAMINTPRLIGRRQHMPHAGLQRKLARAMGMTGKFPLRAWTEIKLEVGPPKLDDGGEHEGRLTGAKALHFCRAHLRVRLGKVEIVRGHWRGDASLGIKRSRYTLVPPRSAPGGASVAA